MLQGKAPLWGREKKRIVIIGSGIGGMASGALFARHGHKVHILEQHPDFIGGHARHLTIDGLRFCLGPQYCWHFNKGDIGDRFLEWLEIKQKTPFHLMASGGFETVFIGHNSDPGGVRRFDVPMGLDRFLGAMLQWFPDDAAGLKRLFRDLTAIYNGVCRYQDSHPEFEGSITDYLRFLCAGEISMSVKYRMVRAGYVTLQKFFDGYRISSMARRVLYGHGGIFTENESEIAALVFLVATGHYHRGAFLPVHGFDVLFDALRQAVEAHQGTVTCGKRVKRLEVAQERVTRVICADGQTIECDAVFSDLSHRLTAGLLPSAVACSYSYEPSRSLPAVCIVLKGDMPEFQAIKGRNYWWQDGKEEIDYHHPDVTKPPRMLFVTSPTANGFRQSTNGDSAHSLLAFYAGNYEQEKEIYARGDEAVAGFKSRIADETVRIIKENMIPSLGGNIKSIRVESTIDIEQQILAERGNIYGKRMNLRDFTRPLGDEPAVSNLFNVSATKNGAGIVSGISGAVALLHRLTGEKI